MLITIRAARRRCATKSVQSSTLDAFEIACRTGAPVVPLVMDMQPRWLGKGQGIFPIPRTTPRLNVSVLPAVHPTDHGSSSRRLRDVISGEIRGRLGGVTDQPATEPEPVPAALPK